MKALVLGAGEVGTSLARVLGAELRDITEEGGSYEVIHICFPYSESFEAEVRRYQSLFNPRYTIIHSTVPIGTTEKLGCYHSPVRGVHPHLEKAMRTFITYLAPPSEELKDYLESKGMRVYLVKRTRDTEALKLFSTLYYAHNIIFEKEVYRYCRENNLDFDLVYTHSNQTYNEGYRKLGRKEVIRPVLRQIDGGIGGHCLIPNAHILAQQGFDLAKFILERNETFSTDRKTKKGDKGTSERVAS